MLPHFLSVTVTLKIFSRFFGLHHACFYDTLQYIRCLFGCESLCFTFEDVTQKEHVQLNLFYYLYK